MSSSIAKNLNELTDQIQRAGAPFERGIEDVTLVAVSKKQPAARVKAALAAGHRCFGENRVQEARERWGPLRAEYPDLQLHLVGPLQSNKAKDAVALFDVIETVDRSKIAEALKSEMDKQGRDLPVFVQVNTGEEPQKAGIRPTDALQFIRTCQEDIGLNVVGLMCIPPANDQPAPHFALLKQLAEQAGLAQLSMGMSGDFEAAVALGATHVRLGTAVFGSRPAAD